jgi:FAD/FMN-containing dehydrogenase/Fe-S oxidoreductase
MTSTPLSAEGLRALADDLRLAGVSDVRFDKAHRVLYSTDASIYEIEPIGVVVPRHEEEIIATVSVCAQQGVPVLPRGGGSSLAGQTVGRAVVLDTSKHLDQILALSAEERWVRCQPGIVVDRLNAALRSSGLMLGPDPASSNRATVGGTLANNGTGAHSILYGMMVDHVRAARVVLSDGSMTHLNPQFLSSRHGDSAAGRIAEALPRLLDHFGEAIQRDYPRHWRRASGYSLDKLLRAEQSNPAQLLAGSEGTLAFMTEVTLNLVPRPSNTVLAIVHFDDLVAAAEATVPILELKPSAVELMDKHLMDLCRRQPEYARRLTFVRDDPACVLAVEFYVDSEREGEARLAALEAHLAASGHRGALVPLLDTAAQANAWAVRKAGLGLLLSQRGDVKPVGIIEDVAVPPEHLADYVAGVLRLFAAHEKTAAFYAHASAGCLHIRPLLNLKDAHDITLIETMQAKVLEMIRPWGGALSGEHGDGLKHTHRNVDLFGGQVSQAFLEVKRIFDPYNIFNPGKKVTLEQWAGQASWPSPLLDVAKAPLRFGPSYRTWEFPARFDWTADGGFARAVEMCNGSGDCRKLDVGVMCPSFQATREEEHSTRGRANLLRAALSGQLPPEALSEDRLDEALDLCLGCKACKTECPSSVDMAKIKTEVLALRHATHGTPLPARLFGHIHTINSLATPVAPLANAVATLAPIRRLLERATGLHSARSLPSFAARTFPAWFRRWRKKEARFGDERDRIDRPLVLLFPDTFMTYNYPQVGKAAVRLLEAAGFLVQLAPRVCCGRPMLSQGLIEDARRQAQRNVDLLYPLASASLPILFCEPSCATAFLDEYPDLLPSDRRVVTVIQQVRYFDDWLAQQLSEGLSVPWKAMPRQVLFHGHCHQKASGGTAGSLTALAAVPGHQITSIDAGCCGMAGAFGYTAEHYELSQTIAFQRLIPAIEAAPHAVICANGASCRQQIEHFTGRPARHLVELLADALELSG